jgi:ribosomal protein S18 acetylase RimI-like enzyme
MPAAPNEIVITEARFPQERAAVVELLREYAASLGFDLCFQGFEGELATLPGDYAAPPGRLLLARVDGALAGCVALRPLGAGACEMKRLYVRPARRGLHVGRRLVEALLKQARAIGYATMRLDTVPSMVEAIALYESLRFRDIPPCRPSPIPGAAASSSTSAPRRRRCPKRAAARRRTDDAPDRPGRCLYRRAVCR